MRSAILGFGFLLALTLCYSTSTADAGGGPEVNVLLWSTWWNAPAHPSNMIAWFGVPDDGVVQCDPQFFNGTCRYTADRKILDLDKADALWWHVRDFKSGDLPPDRYMRGSSRDGDRPLCVYYSLEAAWLDETEREHRQSQEFCDMFDARMISGGGESHLQSYIPTGFISWFPNILGPPKVDPTQRRPPSPILWAANNCYSQSNREYWVAGIQKHMPGNGKVNSIGICMPSGPNDSPNQRLLHASPPGSTEPYYDPKIDRFQYKFDLTFENTLCTEYTSEKLWRAFDQGRVPVVLGGSERGGGDVWRMWAPAAKSMIMADSFDGPKELAEYLDYLDSNITAYLEYHSWRGGMDDLLKKHGLDRQPLRPEFLKSTRGLMQPADQWCNLCNLAHQFRRGKGLKLERLIAENSCVSPPPTPTPHSPTAATPTPTPLKRIHTSPPTPTVQFGVAFGGGSGGIEIGLGGSGGLARGGDGVGSESASSGPQALQASSLAFNFVAVIPVVIFLVWAVMRRIRLRRVY